MNQKTNDALAEIAVGAFLIIGGISSVAVMGGAVWLLALAFERAPVLMLCAVGIGLVVVAVKMRQWRDPEKLKGD